MTTYTITAHSGLGRLALEPAHAAGHRELETIRRAGGVILPSYGVADQVADAMLCYSNGGIVPSGVAGTFSAVTFRGLPLWIPDAKAQALLRVGEECAWSVPVSDLLTVADAVLAPQASH